MDTLGQALDSIFSNQSFGLAIYLAGADPFREDRLGRICLTKEGLAARDQLVLNRLFQLQIPVAIAMAGGYAPNVKDIVDIHAATVGIAKSFFLKWQQRQLTSE